MSVKPNTMGRLTKTQKESRGGVKGVSEGSKDGRKRGFNTIPVKAPKTAYLGKAKKIKSDLIERAKLKQSYAKVLKAEGMSSERLSNRDKPFPAIEEDAEAPLAEPQPSEPKKGKERSDRQEKKETMKEVRALSPAEVGPPVPQSSYRQLKKEAFSKYHPSKSGSQSAGFGRGPRGQPDMGARMGALLEKIKRDRAN